MKRVLIFVLLISSGSFSQSLKCKIGGSLNLHLRQKESSGAYNYQYSHEIEYPSIAAFFDDGVGLNIDVSYRFGNENTKKGQTFFGLIYERCGINSNSNDAKYILGENIMKTKFVPYYAYGIYLDPEDYYTFFYGFGGFVIKNYSGESIIPGTFNGEEVNVDAKYSYTNSLSIRLGAGIDFENIGETPITISIQGAIEVGKISRGNVYYYYHGEKIGEGIPTGEKSMYDNTIYFVIYVGYQLNWENILE